MSCIVCHGISKSYGFYFPADEFGYWSYAAGLAGYDWSDIASLGSYYSYGYSLILLPVFLIFKDGVIAYRAAMVVNIALLAVCFFIRQKMGRTFYAAAAVFYPTWLFYAGTTFAEILLVTLYLTTCMLLLKYLQTDNKRYMALMLAAMFYMYLVHLRAIGVLVSGTAVLLLYNIRKYSIRKYIMRNGGRKVRSVLVPAAAAAVILAVGLLMGLFIKNYWTGMVYGDTADTLKNANDYAGQFEKIAYIFSIEGLKNLIISVSGKILYLGLASYGIAYFGIIYAVRRVREKKYFPLFVLLTTVAALMICAIYTIRPGRVDTLTYGRYHEYVMPVLLMMGIKELGSKAVSAKRTMCRIAVMLELEAVMTWLVTASLNENGQTSFFGNTICGISWLYNPQDFEPVSYYWKVYLTGAVLTVAVCMGIWWTVRRRGREILLMLLVTMQIVIGIRLSSMCIDDSRLGCFRDTLLREVIYELNPEGSREVYYSTEGNAFGNIGILQFMMRDTPIHIVKTDYDLDSQNEEDLLLIDFRSDQGEALAEKYDSHLTSGHFALYYNE
ncbi:MAG: hypothetical protein K1V99_11700 [Bacteroidales bacterium]